MSDYTFEDIERIAHQGRPTEKATFVGIRRFGKRKVHFVYVVRPKRLADDEAGEIRAGMREASTISRRIHLKFETVLKRALMAEGRAA